MFIVNHVANGVSVTEPKSNIFEDNFNDSWTKPEQRVPPPLPARHDDANSNDPWAPPPVFASCQDSVTKRSSGALPQAMPVQQQIGRTSQDAGSLASSMRPVPSNIPPSLPPIQQHAAHDDPFAPQTPKHVTSSGVNALSLDNPFADVDSKPWVPDNTQQSAHHQQQPPSGMTSQTWAHPAGLNNSNNFAHTPHPQLFQSARPPMTQPAPHYPHHPQGERPPNQRVSVDAALQRLQMDLGNLGLQNTDPTHPSNIKTAPVAASRSSSQQWQSHTTSSVMPQREEATPTSTLGSLGKKPQQPAWLASNQKKP